MVIFSKADSFLKREILGSDRSLRANCVCASFKLHTERTAARAAPICRLSQGSWSEGYLMVT